MLVGVVALSATVAMVLGGTWWTVEALRAGRPLVTLVRFLASIVAGGYFLMVARFGYLQWIRLRHLPYWL